MEKITLGQLINKGAIYFTRIEEGFADYSYQIIEGSEAELKKCLMDLIHENGRENSWVDFYYGRLKSEEKERILTSLTDDEKQLLEAANPSENDLYFALTEELFEITFRLSVTEMLFSTFYFTKTPCTVWSSFENKFVLFYLS